MSDLQSVRRALQILDALQELPELGVSDVAERLGVSSSTAHRLLSTMEAEGYVRHISGGRRYELGSALQSVRYSTQIDACVEAARPHMLALRELSQETVHLAILASTTTRFLLAAESAQIMRVGSRLGQRLPAHRTAGGKVLLAQLPDAEVALLYGRQSPGSAGYLTRPEIDGLLRELAATRSTGVGVNHGESEAGVTALAVPLTLPGGIVICSLTISGPSSRIEAPGPGLSERERELLAMLRTAARAIEREIHV